ncbi:ATP-binding protein [Roseomonas sp. USHLN139]|uniref:ATP-binding protein n=1 Tax=Roseomonas sp. USHLN139 TaxID=3081298 RepID=UPI003B01A6C3
MPIHRRGVLVAIAIWIGCLLLIAGGSCLYIQREFRDAEHEEEATLEAEVVAVEQALLRVAEEVDWLHRLAASRHGLEDKGNFGAAQALAEQLVSAAKKGAFGVAQVALIGANGHLEWSTVPGFQPVDLRDRLHWRVFAERQIPYDETFITAPVLGRASNRSTMQFARAQLNDRGSLIGVSVVSLDPQVVSGILDSVGGRSGHLVSALRIPGGAILGRSRSGDPTALHLANSTMRVIGTSLDRGDRRAYLRRDYDPDEGMTINAVRPVLGSSMAAVVSTSSKRIRGAVLDEQLPAILMVDTALASLSLLGCFALWIAADRRRVRQALAEAAHEQRAMELALADTERLLRGLPAAVYRGHLDASGNLEINFISNNACRISGWKDLTVVTPSWLWQHMEPEALQAQSDFNRKLAMHGEAKREFQFRKQSGGWLLIRDSARIEQRGDDGSAIVIGQLIDVTEERLLQQRAQATSRMAALGEMASGLAHEINQPFAISSLAAENVAFSLRRLEMPLPESVFSRLARIVAQSARGQAILDQLRAFCKDDDGVFEVVNLADVVDSALILYRHTLHSSGISLDLKIDPDVKEVIATPAKLQQVLVSVLTNAREAILERNPDVRRVLVTLSEEDEGPVLTIADSGGGIKPEVQSRMFEPFFTTKGDGQGRGLGLSVCRSVLMAIGGRIEAYNNDEGGASFSFHFKRAQQSVS